MFSSFLLLVTYIRLNNLGKNNAIPGINVTKRIDITAGIKNMYTSFKHLSIGSFDIIDAA